MTTSTSLQSNSAHGEYLAQVRLILVLATLMAAIGQTACVGDVEMETGCVPGTISVCQCADGSRGEQTCADDSQNGPCVCDASVDAGNSLPDNNDISEDGGNTSEDEGDIPEDDGDVPEDDGDVPEDDGDVPEDDGDVPEDDGDIPEDDGDVPDLVAPSSVSASDGVSSDHVEISWSPVLAATRYSLLRDGVEIANDLTETTYLDTEAEVFAPTAEGLELSVDETATGPSIVVTWGDAVVPLSQVHEYAVIAENDAGERGPSSPIDEGFRSTQPVIGYQLQIDDGTWLDLGNVQIYEDDEAPLATFSLEQVAASDGESASGVILSAQPAAMTVPERTYRVRATNSAGEGSSSDMLSVTRPVGEPTYQWQRSAGDTDADYEDLLAVEGLETSDDSAPDDGTGRFYRVSVSAEGASTAVSPADSGFRALVPSRVSDVEASQGTEVTHVHVSWAEADSATSYEIYRDAVLIGTTTNTTYDDYEATPSTQDPPTPTHLVASEGSAANAIILSWETPTILPGPGQTYQVVAVNEHADGEISEGATGYRAGFPIVRYEARRNDGEWFDIGLPLDNTWSDTEAPVATLSDVTVSAWDGNSPQGVGVEATVEVNNGSSVTYEIRSVDTTLNSSAQSNASTGFRAAGEANYRWERSETEEEGSTYSEFRTSTASLIFDYSAPENGDVRWYRVEVSAEGVDAVTSGADSGFLATYPTVSLRDPSVSDVNSSGVSLHATLEWMGYPTATDHGFCWSTNPDPSRDDILTETTCVELGPPEEGDFDTVITELTSATTYHFRAWATSCFGDFYSEAATFTTTLGPPIGVSATQSGDLDASYEYVRVIWEDAPGSETYNVYRDEELVGVSVTSPFFDFGADPPSVLAAPSEFSVSDGTFADYVEVLWDTSASVPAGATHQYTVTSVASMPSQESLPSTPVDGSRSGSPPSDYEIEINDSGFWTSIGTSGIYHDYSAPIPTYSGPGTALAGDGTSLFGVPLELQPEITSESVDSYRIRTVNSEGAGPESSPATGYRAIGGLDLQWQRSTDASDGDYVDLYGATASTYLDNTAPFDGETRFYRCLVTPAGGPSEMTNTDPGYRHISTFEARGTGEYFGYAVDIDDDVLIAGTQSGDGLVSDSGTAMVYRYSDGAGWSEEAELYAADGQAWAQFGTAVAVSNDWAIVGALAHHASYPTVTYSGAAYFFQYTDSGGGNWTWEALPGFDGGDTGGSDQFGTSVDVDGTVAVVGSPLHTHDTNGNGSIGDDPRSGSVYVYRYIDQTWQLEAELLPSDAATDDRFGTSVNLGGDLLIVGSPNHPVTPLREGAAYVFRYDGSTWTEEAILQAGDVEIDDHFGESVQISGNLALVGSPDDDEGNTNSGAAYLFEFDGVSTWTETTKLTSSDPQYNLGFGCQLSLWEDWIVAGTWYANNRIGRAELFSNASEAGWISYRELNAFNGDDWDFFGWSVSIDDDWLTVGASRRNTSGNDGAVYVYWLGSE